MYTNKFEERKRKENLNFIIGDHQAKKEEKRREICIYEASVAVVVVAS